MIDYDEAKAIAADVRTPAAIAERIGQHPAAVSRSLRRLLERGHVEMRKNEYDGRFRIFSLTKLGREALSRVVEKRKGENDG